LKHWRQLWAHAETRCLLGTRRSASPPAAHGHSCGIIFGPSSSLELSWCAPGTRRLAEIRAEDYAFVLLSSFLNILDEKVVVAFDVQNRTFGPYLQAQAVEEAMLGWQS
jgi:hypothetical protein